MDCFHEAGMPAKAFLISSVACSIALLVGGAPGAHSGPLTNHVLWTEDAGDTMVSTQDTVVLHRLQLSEQTGRLDGLEIEIWTGGGQPPPWYRSDQFRLLVSNNHDGLEFARIRFDTAYDPPDLVEKFQLVAQPADVQLIARLLRESGAFAVRYTEEENPGVADILRTEILISWGGQQHKRVYYRTVPGALTPLMTEIDRQVERLIAHGQRGLYHRGKRVG
jgi:hypothetical protein